MSSYLKVFLVNFFISVPATTTPLKSISFNSTSSSCKRKCDELSDTESPLNHKRHKYEGRIRGRPPLRRSKTCVASLRSSMSAEQKSLISELTMSQEEAMNLSFWWFNLSGHFCAMNFQVYHNCIREIFVWSRSIGKPWICMRTLVFKFILTVAKLFMILF